MLTKKEEEKIRSNTKSLFTVSTTILSVTIAVFLYFYSHSITIEPRFTLLAFFLIITVELCFFTISSESWYIEVFYNFARFFFFISMCVMFLGFFDLPELVNFNGLSNCVVNSVGRLLSNLFACLVFLFFVILYLLRSQLVDSFKEKFWYKIVLILVIMFLIFYFVWANSFISCLNLQVSVSCNANWLEQGEMNVSLCRTACYDKYNVLSYEIREGVCYCDVNDCKG